MNTGVIASRYARALLLLTQESGRGEQVFSQARALLADPSVVPSPLEPDLGKLVLLLRKNGRGEYMKFVLNDFVHSYCASKNARLAHLTTAVPAPELGPKLAEMLEKKAGIKVYLDSEVDPSIEGGFIFTLDDYMLDASVKGQIDRIRREFISRNQRIV